MASLERTIEELLEYDINRIRALTPEQLEEWIAPALAQQEAILATIPRVATAKMAGVKVALTATNLPSEAQDILRKSAELMKKFQGMKIK